MKKADAEIQVLDAQSYTTIGYTYLLLFFFCFSKKLEVLVHSKFEQEEFSIRLSRGRHIILMVRREEEEHH